ncbi:MAG TPA: chromosome segregation protein SMC [Pseudogracilibacillus sp.]|nr:chromosome segregation protein SMC [Pseudogracilibacillus sp.]
MFLKQLDTVGFKSFAERTKIDFVKGVTAVVGPNGSGKSNIIDAVRWVLGEQSAKSLRGSKMEDVIFQGSDTRHPLNFAEVTLLLNNHANQLPIDYKEVSVTRRVYRSGDSEFYINKQACRLKDIIDLFMDSGLGKESFTIIGQGKVEEILSSKAEERRAIFEEAAGVLKYKQRKRQAQFKLVETEDNLSRVEDIIYEIDQQIIPLEKQAEIANLYLTKNKQLKKVEISLLITEISEKHLDWQQNLKEIEILKDKEMKLATYIQTLEAKLAKDKEKANHVDIQLQEIQTELLNATEELENTEGKRNVLHERHKHFSENKLTLEKDIHEISLAKEKAFDLVKTENDKFLTISKKHQEILMHINKLKKELQFTEEGLSEKLDNLKAEYIELLNQQAVTNNELNSATNRITQIKGSNELASLNQKDKLAERELMKEQLANLSKKIEIETEKLKTINETSKIETDELSKQQVNYEEMRNKLQEANETIARLTSRKDTLEEMRDSYQGYFFGVKEVLRAAKQNKLSNIHGIVLDLIDVPKSYITAIDTVLGGQAQNIVVQDDMAARNAINWLKKENKGRATFLPIESMNNTRQIPQSTQIEIENHSGFIGIAANLIKTDQLYQQLISYLMGNIIVAKTLKDANELAKLTKRRYRIVTLDGDVVFPGGSMSGGAKRKVNQSLFTREKDLATLTQKLTDFTARTKTYEDETQRQINLIENVKVKLKQINETKEKQNEYLNQLNEEKQTVQKSHDELNDNLLIYDLNKEQTENEMKENQQKIDQLNKALIALKTKLEHINSEIATLTSEQENKLANQAKLNKELHQLEIKFAESEEQLKHQKANNKRAEYEYQTMIDKEQELKNNLTDLIKLSKEEITSKDMDQLLIEKEKNKEKITFKLKKQRKMLDEMSVLISDDEREVAEEIKKREKTSNQIQEEEVKANRLDVTLETKINYLQTTYSISFERAVEKYDKTTNLKEATAEINILKDDIKKLGNVNTGAIEEFSRIQKRYTFITAQQKDLLEAKQTLYDVITEMDEEMIALFTETFNQIQKEFQVVFKELFGGGYAELSLSDPENLLDTGVDIIARPPGKKLRSLSLLSGGERALTAIALLFSILKVRPVPFCILDEVEAALDEANVVRFAKYVKMHSDEIQFIVITHRRGTMEEADALYGVTMQESGVSRLVSVRLDDTDYLDE